MSETLTPPSADLARCSRAHTSLGAWFQVVEGLGLYSPLELIPAVVMKFKELDKAIMNPGSVTIPKDLPQIMRASLPTNELRLAYDEELKRLEARQLESRRAIVSAQLGEAIDKSFAKEETKSSTSRNWQPILVPKENPSLSTVIKKVLINFQDEWRNDLPLFTSYDTADQLKEGVRIAYSKLRQIFTFRSRTNVPLMAQQGTD